MAHSTSRVLSETSHNPKTCLNGYKAHQLDNPDPTKLPVFKKELPAATLFSGKQGLGIPIHIPYTNIICTHEYIIFAYTINYCTLLVLNNVLYINYIGIAIDPFLDPCIILEVPVEFLGPTPQGSQEVRGALGFGGRMMHCAPPHES